MLLLSNVYLGVNAGGWSRRWGGVDKALQFVDGCRLIEQVLTGLASLPLLGICVRSVQLNSWAVLDYPLWVESEDELLASGPLRGIYRLLVALDQQQGEWLLVLPCDMPNITEAVVQQLMDVQQRHNAQCVHVRDAEGRDAMVALIHVSCVDALRQFLQQGGCRYREWLRCVSSVACVWRGEAAVLLNLNTPPLLNASFS